MDRKERNTLIERKKPQYRISIYEKYYEEYLQL